MAFHDLRGLAAQQLLVRDYGSTLAAVNANPAASVAASGRVVRYIGNNVALVRSGSSLERETSSVPLRVAHGTGGEKPVNLTLQKSGASFVAVNPLHRVSISERLGGGVALGSSSIRLIPQGADARAQVVGARSVFYPEVGTDEDASVAPTIGGVELSTVLRSRMSPQQISYRVVLPKGAVLRSAGAGAVIFDGETVMRVHAPTARDAQGQSVPVRMTVNGDQLVLYVAPRRMEVAYPLLVDPSVTEDHCCGEWRFEGPEWGGIGMAEKGFIDSEPGVLEAETGRYRSGEEREANQYWENRWGEENGWMNTKMTFYGVEFGGGNTGGIIVGSIGGLCQGSNKSQSYEWNSSENGAPPSTLVFPSREEYAKDSFHWCEPDGFAMLMGTEREILEPFPEGCESLHCTTTAPVRLAIGSVLIIARSEKTRKHHRRRGVRHREVFGPNNPGEPNQFRVCEGKPVECATGNETETQTDLNIPGIGVPLALTRTYNSQAAVTESKPGPFGYGWSASFTDQLNISESAQTVTVEQADGSTVVFKGNPRVAGELTPPRWAQARLIVESSGAFQYTLPNQETFHFSESGVLSSETDRNGNTTTVSHNSKGQIETVTDPSGRKLTFKYNGSGEVESIKDPLSYTVKYTYESGNLASVTEPGESSARWQFKYDSSHELTEMIDGRGGKTVNEYNGAHQVVLQKDPMGRVLKFEYEEVKGLGAGEYLLPSLAGETSEEETEEEAGSEELTEEVVVPAPEAVTKVTHEGTGAVMLEHYNNEDALQFITKGYGTSIATTEKIKYSEAGNMTSRTDGNGHTTKYGYEGEGNRTEEVNPDGDTTKWEYDKTHDVISTTTPDGETTTIKREAHGNPESISRPAPGETTQTTKYVYKANGELESVTNPLERTWKYEYDSYGDRTSEIDPEGNKRTWEYNKDSQEIATVSPRGNASGAKASEFTTKTERDAQGRPLKITDPLGHTTKYTYDGDGDVETVVDGNSRMTKYTYDADNELTKTEEPNKAVTETEYDSMGQVKSQTDGNKHVTKYVRNVLEEIEEVVNPLGKKTLKEYDAAGNLVKLTDPAKRTTTYTYDPASRLIEISYSSGKPATIKYEYNKDGDLTKMTDGTGTSINTLDQLDRMTESENGHKEVVKYEYNLGNQQTKITYPNTKTVERAYDKDGRLEKITDWNKNVTIFKYSADSQLEKTVFPSATKDEDTYTYTDADQMSEVKMDKSTEVLASLVYTRDNDGQVKKTTAKGLPGTEVTENTYDENNRLTKYGSTEYKYDAANNPTKEGSSTNTYSEGDELEKGTGTTYVYDELGERTKTTPEKGPATTYGYDQAGNLTSVERPEKESVPKIEDTYAYNGNGLRVSQTISGTTTYLAWDVSEELPLLLSDGTNSYIYGPGGLPLEQINTSTGTVTYLHHDQAGSTRLLTGSTGTVTGKCTYGAYGTPTCEGSTTTPLGYDGQYTNSDTGLIYLRAREYDPATAQFLSVDPLKAVSGEPYSYAGDNPLNYSDPTGLLFGIELPSPEEAAEAVAGWGDKLTLGATKWAREELGDENVNTCSAAYQTGGYAGLATAVLIPGEDEAVGADEGVGIAEGSAEHIFRDAEGHLAEDTPENRALIESAVKSENYVRTGGRGEELYRETLSNGTQVWAKVFNGSITNGGLNQVPLP